MATKELTLKTYIIQRLRTEFGDAGEGTCPDDHVTIIISRNNCEQNYGTIL